MTDKDYLEIYASPNERVSEAHVEVSHEKLRELWGELNEGCCQLRCGNITKSDKDICESCFWDVFEQYKDYLYVEIKEALLGPEGEGNASP